jgi:hypothetical protein
MVRGLWVMMMNCVFFSSARRRLVQGGVDLVEDADRRRVSLQQR